MIMLLFAAKVCPPLVVRNSNRYYYVGGVYGDDLMVECKAGYGVQVLQQNSFITQCTVEAVWEPVYQCDGKYDFIVYITCLDLIDGVGKNTPLNYQLPV